MMNIRDYIFIRKAKSSNKIRILELLGFEPNTEIIQNPELTRNIEANILNSDIESFDIDVKNATSVHERTEFEKFITKEIENKETATETFEPLRVTSQLKKIWIDLEKRRKWLLPSMLSISIILIVSLATSIYINNRNKEIEIINLYSTLTIESNLLVKDLNQIILIATDEFYSKYDVSNASAKLQLIESTLMEYERNLTNRNDIVITLDLENNLKSIFQLINELDDLITYRILNSEILIYEESLSFNNDVNIDDLSNTLSEISATSNLNYENLPKINEFEEHINLLETTLISAEDLHGRLIAALRNNEIDVANSMVFAINLNKDTEQVKFYKNLKTFKNDKLIIFNNIKVLP